MEEPSSILIVKTSALGDIVHVFPVVEYLRQRFPKAAIDWVVEQSFAALVKSHPEIRFVFPVHTKVWRRKFFNPTTFSEIWRWRKEVNQTHYDIVFDLQGNIKSGFLLLLVKGDHKVGFGRHSVPEWPNLLFTNRRYEVPKGQNIREDYLCIAQRFFLDSSSFTSQGVQLRLSEKERSQLASVCQSFPSIESPRILVCPGAFWKNKQLPYHSLKEFLKHIEKQYHAYFGFVWGNPEEEVIAHHLQKDFPETSFVVSKLPLPMLQNLMDRVDLVIAMDSLPLHLAGTTKTPAFGLFGPSLATKYKPWGSQHGVYQGRCPYKRTFEKRCPILRKCETGACLREVFPYQLIETFDFWWRKRASLHKSSLSQSDH